MITVNKYQFLNGLRLLHHADSNTRMVAINLLYDVGARDESPDCTGFAHLFEHLMFGGSLHIPDFDTALQKTECWGWIFPNIALMCKRPLLWKSSSNGH